jgi:hypothetical protein
MERRANRGKVFRSGRPGEVEWGLAAEIDAVHRPDLRDDHEDGRPELPVQPSGWLRVSV